MEDRELNCPLCPDCGHFMLQSMCIAYNEYVCVPCGIAKPFSFGERNLVLEKVHDELYNKYEKDIHKLAFTEGGAYCNVCLQYGGNNCETCNIEYAFKYWGMKNGN